MASHPPVQRNAAQESRANGRRLGKVEVRVTNVEALVAAIKSDTDEIKSLIASAKSVTGFARKYVKPAIVFGAGIFTSAGLLNPAVGKFIAHFFGG